MRVTHLARRCMRRRPTVGKFATMSTTMFVAVTTTLVKFGTTFKFTLAVCVLAPMSFTKLAILSQFRTTDVSTKPRASMSSAFFSTCDVRTPMFRTQLDVSRFQPCGPRCLQKRLDYQDLVFHTQHIAVQFLVTLTRGNSNGVFRHRFWTVLDLFVYKDL